MIERVAMDDETQDRSRRGFVKLAVGGLLATVTVATTASLAAADPHDSHPDDGGGKRRRRRRGGHEGREHR